MCAPQVLGEAVGTHKTITLKEGDVLYIPSGWFREVVLHNGEHISVNMALKPLGWETVLEQEKALNKTISKQLQALRKKSVKVAKDRANFIEMEMEDGDRTF